MTCHGKKNSRVGEFLGIKRKSFDTLVTYFAHLKQITDPAVANSTTMGNIQSLSTLKAIADASGAPIFVNPAAGQLGALGQGVLTGPGTFRLDLNLVKRVRITERVTLWSPPSSDTTPALAELQLGELVNPRSDIHFRKN